MKIIICCLFLLAFAQTKALLNGGYRTTPRIATKLGLRAPYQKTERPRMPSVLICGGGPTGLLCAIMLAKKYQFPIDLYDQRPVPPIPTDQRVWGQIGKHYLIGLGGRGITALEEYGVWPEVAAVSTRVPGRKQWMSKKLEGQEIMLTGQRKYATHVLARDRLVSVLHQHVKNNYSEQITLNYGHDVRPLSFEEDKVLVEVKSGDSAWKTLASRFLIAADGSARTFANRMEEDDRREGVPNPFRVIRFEDDNPRVFKSIPFSVPAHWRKDINYAVRSGDGRVNFDALPADGKGAYLGTLLLPEDDEMAQPNVDPIKFGQFLDEYLPQFSSRFQDKTVVDVATAGSTTLPKFRYVKPRLQHKNRTVLLGDCAHTVKPYFGMGANSALEDVKILGQCIESGGSNFNSVISKFSDTRASDVATLVQISHGLDRPGVSGTIRFLVPIILDGILSKLFPDTFSPNIIRMIQREDITFQEAARRKRIDRMRQATIFGICLVSILSGGQRKIIGRLTGVVLLPLALGKLLSRLFATE